jgi:hypothetical protein
MILLWGLQSDETLASVDDWLRQRKASVYFLDHAAIDRTRMSYSAVNNQYQLYYNDELVPLDSVTAAYLRPYDFRQYPPFQQGDDVTQLTARAVQVHNLMNTWSESTIAKVINTPSAEATNHSKVFQSRLIHSSTGLPVPDTLISNDWETIRRFALQHGTLVYKSLSSIRSIAKQITHAELLERRDTIAPALFQQKITGTNVRVHVVGKKTFACGIQSDVLDYRYGPRTIHEMELPPDIHDKCIVLSRHLGLLLAGIDFIVTPGNEWYCLEANPNPGFSFYDTSAEKVIARAVADLLLSYNRQPSSQ